MKKSEVILKRWRRELLHRIDGRPERGGLLFLKIIKFCLFLFVKLHPMLVLSTTSLMSLVLWRKPNKIILNV